MNKNVNDMKASMEKARSFQEGTQESQSRKEFEKKYLKEESKSNHDKNTGGSKRSQSKN